MKKMGIVLNFSKTGSKLYEGQYIDDVKDGIGKLYNNKEELIYEGEFKNDLQDGQGIEYINNNKHYEGNWKK